MKTEITKLENSQVLIKVILPQENLEKYRESITKQSLKNVHIDGFRKGHVPENLAVKQLNTMQIFEEMAQKAVSQAYLDILQKESIKAIGHPEIVITKIAEGNDLEFTVTTAVLPEVILPDYKKIAKDENTKEYSNEISEDEVNEALLNLRKMRAQQETPEGEEKVSWSDLKPEDLPELSDEWVKTLGNFESVDALTKKIKENLQQEKESKNFEKKRISYIDAILENSTIEVPKMMTDYEIDKMMHEFEYNISLTGTSFDEYLKSINKTRDDYKKEWHDQGYKRAQTQLMLNHIAATEKIDPSDEDIEKEVSKIMEQYKNQKGVDENNVRAYVATILTHQKVFEFLEAQK